MFAEWRSVQQRVSAAAVQQPHPKEPMKSILPGITGVVGKSDNRLPEMDVDFGVYSTQGHRPYQEDEFALKAFLGDGITAPESHMFAVFDGHAGGRASKYLSTSFAGILVQDPVFDTNISFALKRCYLVANEQFLKQAERLKLHDGSCGLTCILREGKLIAANVGDCRAVIVHRNNPLQITSDHKPYDQEERKRIAALGGTVVYSMGTARVNGVLAVSRAFGNRSIKHVIRADADIFVRDFAVGDEFLVIASDGLWDVLTNKDVCDICRQFESQGARRIAEELVTNALCRGTMDNTTAVVVSLKKYVEKWLVQKTPPPRFIAASHGHHIEPSAGSDGTPVLRGILSQSQAARGGRTTVEGYSLGSKSRDDKEYTPTPSRMSSEDEFDEEIQSLLDKIPSNSRSGTSVTSRIPRVSPLSNRLSPISLPSASPPPSSQSHRQRRPNTTATPQRISTGYGVPRGGGGILSFEEFRQRNGVNVQGQQMGGFLQGRGADFFGSSSNTTSFNEKKGKW